MFCERTSRVHYKNIEVYGSVVLNEKLIAEGGGGGLAPYSLPLGWNTIIQPLQEIVIMFH